MLSDSAVIGVFLILTVGFPIGAIATAFLFRPHFKNKPNDEKLAAYECGVDTQGRTWIRYKINYFLFGLVFLVFDVATIFLLPWAVEFQKLGLLVLVEVIVFMVILLSALAYAWREGALEWY